MGKLEGRVVIVTGAGRGLGREHALYLAAEGAKVVVNDPGVTGDGGGHDDGPAAEVVSDIRAAGGTAIADTGRVDDWAAAERLVDRAVGTFGGLDVLVNNAGILRDATIIKMTEQEWDSVLSVHLKGHFAMLHHAAAYWRSEDKAGRRPNAAVINTGSGSGLRGNPGQANYASAKSAIATLTIVGARELERYGVRCNAIAPVARTRLTLATPGLGERIAARDGEFDTWHPANISPVVGWLGTAECTVNGQMMMIRGGRIDVYDGWTVRETHERESRWTIADLAGELGHLPSGPPPVDPSVK